MWRITSASSSGSAAAAAATGSGANRARTGVFMGRLATPAPLLYTKRGQVPHIAPDMLAPLTPIKALQLQIADFYNEPGVSGFAKFGSGLSGFLSHAPANDFVLFMGLRDPLLNDFGPANDNSFSIDTAKGKARLTPAAFMTLQSHMRPDAFACLADEISSAPDAASIKRAAASVNRSIKWLDACLSIHRTGSVVAAATTTASTTAATATAPYRAPYLPLTAPKQSTKQHNKKRKNESAAAAAAAPAPATATAAGAADANTHAASADRHTKRHKAETVAGAASDSKVADAGTRPAPILFAVVTGGSHLSERIRCAQQISKRCATASAATDSKTDSKTTDSKTTESKAESTGESGFGGGIGGFVVSGLGSGESADQCRMILSSVISTLPSEYPRVAPAIGSPEQVLSAVECGVDLFDGSYPHTLTAAGYAATFQVDFTSEIRQQSKSTAAGVVPSKINLRDRSFERDASAVRAGCECFTCRNHTRAYIHHLLNVHEMLAEVLLQIHNTHHYLSFFTAIRANISGNTFADYKQRFLSRFHAL